MLPNSVKGTRLLFIYDEISKLHFNDYIKNLNNIMLVIDMGNNYVVGGFAGKIANNEDIEDSFLFSLRPHKDPLKLVPKGTISRINADPNYINFGSS
jgi:hypothetical protein